MNHEAVIVPCAGREELVLRTDYLLKIPPNANKRQFPPGYLN